MTAQGLLVSGSLGQMLVGPPALYGTGAPIKPGILGQEYFDISTSPRTAYTWSGAEWLVDASSATVLSVTGTANQITASPTTGNVILSIPATFIAPGSVAATTSLTAILGNITATNGNFVASTVGTGILLNSAQASGAAASPVVVNGRSGRATFTSVSIAAANDLTLTLTNSSITASTTEVMLSMSGATTGSALSIKSKTASAGSLAIIVTNGTGATTTTADIQIDFLVLNT